MKQTTNFNFNKPELTDSPPDITVMNPNFDTIDTKLKEFDEHKDNNVAHNHSDGVTAGGNIILILNKGVLVETLSGAAKNQTSYIQLAGIIAKYTGTYRVRFGIQRGAASSVPYGRIYVNGSARGIERMNDASGTIYFTEDITVNAGDRISIYGRASLYDVNIDSIQFSIAENLALYEKIMLSQ